jgi:GNAT superfamily N-acetyltransferase
MLLYDHLRGGIGYVKRRPMAATELHRKAMAQMLKDKHIHVLVAEEKGKVCGTCTLYTMPRVYWQGRPWGILDGIVVAEDAQGLGIGSKLIRNAIQICKKEGCSQLNLTSNTQRTRAHIFYESLGFERNYFGFKMSFS